MGFHMMSHELKSLRVNLAVLSLSFRIVSQIEDPSLLGLFVMFMFMLGNPLKSDKYEHIIGNEHMYIYIYIHIYIIYIYMCVCVIPRSARWR